MEYLEKNFSCGPSSKDKVSLKSFHRRHIEDVYDDDQHMRKNDNFSVVPTVSNETFRLHKKVKPLVPSSPLNREPLRFHFVGYTIWLELEEESYNFDLRETIEKIATDLDLLPIPYPHVTAIYGMTHISTQEEILQKWSEVKMKIKNWPELIPIGFITDIELAGVDGGTMDMAWSEISYKTSVEHEAQLDTLDEIFFGAKKLNRPKWLPHLSLAYDNPEDSVLSLSHTASVIAKLPSLTERRKVASMSLWDTNGKMSEWTLLDRFKFDE